MNNENKEKRDEGHDYIVKVIQHLDRKHGLSFFITPKDFDSLYNWWQKRIPMNILAESFISVVERWRAKNKEITGFTNFKYEVRKNFKAFLEMSVGSDVGESAPKTESAENGEPVDETFADIDKFMDRFPEPLEPLRGDYEALVEQVKAGQAVELSDVQHKLLALFEEDPELNLKTGLFLKNLAKELRKPAIQQRYRLNFLINRYHIPDFDLN